MTEHNPYESPSTDAKAETPPPRSATRLGAIKLWHVGLMVAAIAVVAVVRLSWVYWGLGFRGQDGYIFLSQLGISAVFDAAIATAVIVAKSTRNASPRLPTQPGHAYLLCLVGLLLLDGAAAILWYINAHLAPVLNHAQAWNAQKIFVCGGGSFVAYGSSTNIVGPRWWKWALQLPAAVLISLCPMHVLALAGVWRDWFQDAHGWSQVSVAAVVFVILTTAVIVTRHDKNPTAWSNRLGIGVLFCLSAFLIVDGVYWLRRTL